MKQFLNTKKALEIYDKEYPTILRLFDLATTDEEVKSASRIERAALTRVQNAYFKDTNNFNSKENCRLASIEFMRRMVELDGK